PNIGVELHAAVVPPPMLGAMRRHAEVQAALASGGSKLTNHVTLRPHLRRIPVADVRVVHGESVAVLAYRHNVAGSGARKQVYPCIRIEMLGAEHRNEILVTKRRLRTVCLHVMFEGGIALLIIFGGNPLVPKSGNKKNPQVKKNPKFSTENPRGNGSPAKRVPIGSEG